MNELILGVVMSLCQNDSACIEKVNTCIDRKWWTFSEYAANREQTDQLFIKFAYECHEELK